MKVPLLPPGRDGFDPESGFHGQIAVFIYNWAKDGAPAGVDWSDSYWGSFWIDGSSRDRKISSPPREQNGTFLAHEMGHGFGFDHDLASDLVSDYGDPYCIMSAMAVKDFTHPNWNVEFGPEMSLPQLMLKNWMYNNRVFHVNANWARNPSGIKINMASIYDTKAKANLGVVLPNANLDSWDYYLEFVRSVGWNKGIGNPKLIIRRLTTGGASAYLGEINLPTTINSPPNEWTEPSGNTHFKVEQNQPDGKIMTVTATK